MNRPFCELYLLIDHPSIDPDEISKQLKLAPQLTQKKGQSTPAGDNHRYKWNKWQHIVDINEQDNLEQNLQELVVHLETHEEYIQTLGSSGGFLRIFFRASNAPVIKTEIDHVVLQSLGRLGVKFGFEFLN